MVVDSKVILAPSKDITALPNDNKNLTMAAMLQEATAYARGVYSDLTETDKAEKRKQLLADTTEQQQVNLRMPSLHMDDDLLLHLAVHNKYLSLRRKVLAGPSQDPPSHLGTEQTVPIAAPPPPMLNIAPKPLEMHARYVLNDGVPCPPLPGLKNCATHMRLWRSAPAHGAQGYYQFRETVSSATAFLPVCKECRLQEEKKLVQQYGDGKVFSGIGNIDTCVCAGIVVDGCCMCEMGRIDQGKQNAVWARATRRRDRTLLPSDDGHLMLLCHCGQKAESPELLRKCVGCGGVGKGIENWSWRKVDFYDGTVVVKPHLDGPQLPVVKSTAVGDAPISGEGETAVKTASQSSEHSLDSHIDIRNERRQPTSGQKRKLDDASSSPDDGPSSPKRHQMASHPVDVKGAENSSS